MSDWDLFSPSATFGDENSQSSNPASAKEQIIYETAKTALEKQTKVQVKTPDETFKAYVQTITYQDDGRLIHFNAFAHTFRPPESSHKKLFCSPLEW